MQYNQPYGMSDPNAPYINGNPATGTAGSIPPAASIEFPQREIVNVISDAGLVAPSNGDLHQMARSIQSQLLQSKDDQGFANELQVTMQPAPTAYFKYMQVICAIANTNTGPTTLNVNAMGPKPVQHFDSGDLQAGELKANSLACFEFDGSKFQIAWTTAGTGIPTPGQPGVSNGPVYLTANADWYVDAGIGSDTLYDGTSPTIVSGTIHGPFKTIQHAAYQVGYYNLNGYNVTIHVADGSYGGFYCAKINGAGEVFVLGNTSNPDACVVTGTNMTAICCQFVGGTYTFRGFKVQAGGSNNDDPMGGITVGGSGTNVALGEMSFGACLGSHISVEWSAFLWNNSPGCPWKVEAGCSGYSAAFPGSFLVMESGASVGTDAFGGPALSFTGPVNYPGAFYQISDFSNAALYYQSISGAGNVTGKKFTVDTLSIIVTNGQGVNYLPGSIAGVIGSSTGGYYT